MWWVWIKIYKPETIGSFFFLFRKIPLGIAQVGVKAWKWSLLENDESPKISPGMCREKGLQVILGAQGEQREGKEGAGNCTQTTAYFPETPRSVSHV